VILGVAIVILGVVLIVQRMGSSRSAAAKSQDELAYARTMIDRLSHATVGPDGRVSVRPAEVENVREVLSRVRDNASDKNVPTVARPPVNATQHDAHHPSHNQAEQPDDYLHHIAPLPCPPCHAFSGWHRQALRLASGLRIATPARRSPPPATPASRRR